MNRPNTPGICGYGWWKSAHDFGHVCDAPYGKAPLDHQHKCWCGAVQQPIEQFVASLVGWAKSGETTDGEGGRYYLMDVTNVDSFAEQIRDHVGGPVGVYPPREAE